MPVISGEFDEDVISTPEGNLKITFVGHGSVMFTWQEKIIHVDPVGRMADYSKMPKADLILVTHQHGDHLDGKVLEQLSTESTSLIWTERCAESLEDRQGIIMKNGEKQIVQGLTIEAVPAYNIKHMRSSGSPYHPKGEGNGYVVVFGDTRVYVAGDTENIPEMKDLKDIAVAFLPMNLPYTMSPEMTADAARSFLPKILYPYHYGQTDTSLLIEMLKDTPEIDVRIKKM
jgi:L-ascorbate metabolism protein UlaG (beta-lactamase superfamily)